MRHTQLEVTCIDKKIKNLGMKGVTRRGGKAFIIAFLYGDRAQLCVRRHKKHATYYGGQGKIAENISQCRKEGEEAR